MPETMSRFSGLQSEILKLLDNASNLIALLEDEYSYKISYPFGDDISNHELPKGLIILEPSMNLAAEFADKAAYAKIFKNKLSASKIHLEKLVKRVSDKKARILVTGDVNSGKSTFINALFGANILPSDQQPCTQAFCEVIPTDCASEYVQAFTSIKDLSTTQSSECTCMNLEEMQIEIQKEETIFDWYQVYLPKSCYPHSRGNFNPGTSNFEFSIIDSPGLNSDLFKTLSVFSKQQDIDVIIFVVNAANHLTLSAQQFLKEAAAEKTHVFFVINKFDEIKNHEKCRKMIIQQIEGILPYTTRCPNDLVHFVSSLNRIKENTATAKNDVSHEFSNLEQSLSQLIFENRIKSKILPAYTYLKNLLNDLILIIQANIELVLKDIRDVESRMDLLRPCYDSLVLHSLPLKNELQDLVNAKSRKIYELSMNVLESFHVSLEGAINETEWKGIWNLSRFRKCALSAVNCHLKVQLDRCFNDSVNESIMTLSQIKDLVKIHAGQVFGDSINEYNMLGEQLKANFSEELMNTGKFCIPELAPWDVIDFKGEFLNARSWLGASTIAASVIGYKPLVTGLVKISDLLLGTKIGSKLCIVSIAGIGSALLVGCIVSNLEAMAKRRIATHCREFLDNTKAMDRFSRSLENSGRKIFLDCSLAFIVRFDTVLHEQRLLKTELDMTIKSSQTHLRGLRQRLEITGNISSALESIKLELNEE